MVCIRVSSKSKSIPRKLGFAASDDDDNDDAMYLSLLAFADADGRCCDDESVDDEDER